MSQERNSLYQYYIDNPNTSEKAIDLAIRFNFKPELSPIKRAKSVRDLKRVALKSLKTGNINYSPTPIVHIEKQHHLKQLLHHY